MADRSLTIVLIYRYLPLFFFLAFCLLLLLEEAKLLAL